MHQLYCLLLFICSYFALVVIISSTVQVKSLFTIFRLRHYVLFSNNDVSNPSKKLQKSGLWNFKIHSQIETSFIHTR